jgi:predicted nucleic acid-binding protein
MDENDLWIASTAIALGAVLITRDSDFSQVPDLKIEDWTQ